MKKYIFLLTFFLFFIYGCNKKIPENIPYMAQVYVLEMNNDTNQVMGIGLIRNYINPKYKICVYNSDTNYNPELSMSYFKMEGQR